jgi:hypothetical protein
MPESAGGGISASFSGASDVYRPGGVADLTTGRRGPAVNCLPGALPQKPGALSASGWAADRGSDKAKVSKVYVIY